MIDVALASDENYFPGLAGTILSLGINTKSKVNITVIDGGISEPSWAKLTTYVEANLPHLQLNKLVPDLSCLDNYKKDRGNSRNTYIRILLGTIFSDKKKIIYVDSDIYFGKDVALLDQISLEGKTALAVQDMGLPTLSYDCPLLEEFELESNLPYFNAGLLVLDLDQWRKYDLERKTLDLLDKHSEKLARWDQTALNVILANKVKFISNEWNYHIIFPIDFQHSTLDYNFHYICKYKPWQSYPINCYYYLFQIILTKGGFGVLDSKKFYYRDYYKLIANDLLSRLTGSKRNVFWNSILEGRKFIKNQLLLKNINF